MRRNTVEKGIVLTFCLVLGLAMASPGLAQPPAGDCAVPPGVGATLLFPYFEVDLNDTNGVSTVLSINNGISSDQLVRVVLWTDWGIPTIAFDLWLQPFDIQTINVRSLFNGVVPSTGAGQDLSAYDFCDAFPPDHANPVITGDELSQLRADHQGVLGPVFSGCAGQAFGDGLVRGYITADVVDECSGVEGTAPFWTPASPDFYFDDGDGNTVAINDNVLWGDYTFLDFTGSAAQGSQAVAIWANESTFPGPNQFTFYGRFHDFDGRDHRVPLPFRFNQRFFDGGGFSGDLIVWRDPGVPTSDVSCGTGQPLPFPLEDSSSARDEDSNFFAIPGNEGFPLATQRTPVSSLNIGTQFGFVQVDTTGPSSPPGQAWVETTLNAGPLGFSASWQGAPVSFLCNMSPNPL